MRLLRLAILTSTVAACGGGSPSPPVVTPPTTAVTINGSERIGWDQPAADAVELAAIGYAIYVDGTRTLASGVSCTSTAAISGFACTAPLPRLTAGAHMLQIASFVTDGALLESARSAALPVNVVPAVITNAFVDGSSRDRSANLSAAASAKAGALARRPDEGFALRLDSRSAKASAERSAERIADGFVDTTDVAVAPDDRLFVAERAGRIVVIDAGAPFQGARSGRPQRPPRHVNGQNVDTETLDPNAGELLAIAIDPEFPRTHAVFAIYTERDHDSATFTLARFRESAGTFGDRAVLLDRVPAGASPHAALRFGADGHLYAAFDAGADRSSDSASFSGKLLRVNPDGTTPRDSPSMTPIVADGFTAPVGLAWPRGARDVWVVDRRSDGSAQLREAGGSRRAFRLLDGFTPSALVWNGDQSAGLLIASADSGILLRVRFDAATLQPLAAERVTLADVDGIRALAVARGGVLYAATPTSLYRVGAE